MAPGRREVYNFPIDSLESTQPLLMKRKKLTKVDVQPVEGWRYGVEIFNTKKVILYGYSRPRVLLTNICAMTKIIGSYCLCGFEFEC